MEKPNRVKAYLGDGAYIFVSYSHKDSTKVLELISILQKAYNVWFDEGIHLGREWDEEIVGKIDGCSLFLYAITENSLSSKNCKDEIAYAKDNGIPFLNVLIDDVALPNLFKLRYGRFQMLKYFEYTDKESLLEDLSRRCEIMSPALKTSPNEGLEKASKKSSDFEESDYISRNYALFELEKEITAFPSCDQQKANVQKGKDYFNDDGQLVYRLVFLPTDSSNAPIDKVEATGLRMLNEKDKEFVTLSGPGIDCQYSSNVLSRGYNCINIDILTDKDIPYLLSKCSRLFLTLRIISVFGVYFDVEYQVVMDGEKDNGNNPDLKRLPQMRTFTIHHSNFKVLTKGLRT